MPRKATLLDIDAMFTYGLLARLQYATRAAAAELPDTLPRGKRLFRRARR